MPAVIRRPPPWAVHAMYMVPSDFVLVDRFGVVQDETVFMQRVEDQILAIRQWFWDTLGGYTFAAAPATYFRSAKTTAEFYAVYPDHFAAALGTLQEMAAQGIVDLRSHRRLYNMDLPLRIGGSGNATGADYYGNPFQEYGAIVGAGHAGRIFGGLFPPFASVPTTIATGANASATTLTVATGTGRNFALAGRRGIFSSQVQSVVASTQFVCSDVDFTTGVTLPFDAVVWPYGQDPTVANAESIQVTAVNTGTRTVTVVRGQHGTSPITIQGGGSGAGGTIIARRVTSARIWTSPAQPEGPGFEVVDITAISGDTLTVIRGRQDAYQKLTTNGANTVPRTILAGDNIVVTEPLDLWFFQNQNQVTGGFAHELGHCFGMKYFNPDEARNFKYVDSNNAVQQKDRIALGEMPGNPSVDLVVGQDFWEHLPHTPYNWNTPGVFGPFVMFDYWDWPFGNVPSPAAGFTADEAARIRACPYITAQARP